MKEIIMYIENLKAQKLVASLKKSIKTPNFENPKVLARDPFLHTELWLKKQTPKTGSSKSEKHRINKKREKALAYWEQAKNYYEASLKLPPISAPLTLYYCYLNAAKTLLTIKEEKFIEQHGSSGQIVKDTKKTALVNEEIRLKANGIISSLALYLGEPYDIYRMNYKYNKKGEKIYTFTKYTLGELLANLPFIHRAYCVAYGIGELFIPLENPMYKKYKKDKEDKEDKKNQKNQKVLFRAEVIGRRAHRGTLSSDALGGDFIIDEDATGKVKTESKIIIRSSKGIDWFSQNDSKVEKETAIEELKKLHHELRLRLNFISAHKNIWYLKRKTVDQNNLFVNRYGMTIIILAMHRLSEMARYDPQRLMKHLEGKGSMVLVEFIQLSAYQFIDEIACEMTSDELRIPGVRH